MISGGYSPTNLSHTHSALAFFECSLRGLGKRFGFEIEKTRNDLEIVLNAVMDLLKEHLFSRKR